LSLFITPLNLIFICNEKQINLKVHGKDNSMILSDAGVQGIVIQEDVLSFEIGKLQLSKEEQTD